MAVVSLESVIPLPRYDNVAWTEAVIEESSSIEGPWEIIDEIDLNPVDTDPTMPMPRNFTTDQATDVAHWFRVTFQDAGGGAQSPTEPMRYDGVSNVNAEVVPTVREVANYLRTRTRDSNGNLVGTFTDKTLPTASDVTNIIYQDAYNDVISKLDDDVPSESEPRVRSLIALRAAMEVELSYFADQIGTDRSPYDRLKDLYDEELVRVQGDIEREAQEEISGESPPVSGSHAFGNFPAGSNWLTRPM